MSVAGDAARGYLYGLLKQVSGLGVKNVPLSRTSAGVLKLNKAFLCTDGFSPKMKALFAMILEIWSE